MSSLTFTSAVILALFLIFDSSDIPKLKAWQGSRTKQQVIKNNLSEAKQGGEMSAISKLMKTDPGQNKKQDASRLHL